MKTLIYLLPVCILMQTISLPLITPDKGQTINVNKSFFRIGDQLITLEKYGRPSDHPFVLVSLYNEETSFIQSAMKLAQSQNAFFLRLVSRQGRNVETDLFNRKIIFDPNSIFTSWGRRVHLKSNHCWSKVADDYVQQFARFVLDEMPGNKTIVMMDPKKSSISDYMTGGAHEKLAKEVYADPAADATSFFITADESIYLKLKENKQNAVLQHAKKLDDDGSLVVFCAKSARPYIYIVSHGGTTEEEMYKTLDGLLRGM